MWRGRLTVKKICNRARYSVAPERAGGRFQLHEAFDVSGALDVRDALEAERIEPARQWASRMNRAARSIQRGASSIGEKAQERSAPNRVARDRRAGADFGRARDPDYVVGRERDNLIAA